MSDAIELIPMERDNAFGLRVQGKITRDDIVPVIELMEEKLAGHDKLRLYAEVTAFQGISLEALVRDILFSVKNARRFERMALVSDTGWLKKIADVEARLLPGIDVQTFSLEQADQARDWVSG